MMKRTIAVMTLAGLATGLGIDPLAAQNYGQPQYQQQPAYQQNQNFDEQNQAVADAFRAGYRKGYDTGRVRGRYNDTPPVVRNTQNDPNQQWRQRYSQNYTYNDDVYYRECRNQPDPAGILAGAFIGGLLGNSVGQGGNRGGATVAGVIIGGALGAGLTSRMDCQDRSYAYRTYYDGFNSNRPNSDWQWENPNNGNYGDFRVGNYYNDPDGFRCATFTQQIYINDRREVGTGHACRQPDGTWAIVN